MTYSSTVAAAAVAELLESLVAYARSRIGLDDEFTSPRSQLDYLGLIRRVREWSGVRAAA